MQHCSSNNTSTVVNILLLCKSAYLILFVRVEGDLCVFLTSVIRLFFLLSHSFFYKGRGDYSNCLDMSRLFNL